jgi:hypothetical protein
LRATPPASRRTAAPAWRGRASARTARQGRRQSGCRRLPACAWLRRPACTQTATQPTISTRTPASTRTRAHAHARTHTHTHTHTNARTHIHTCTHTWTASSTGQNQPANHRYRQPFINTNNLSSSQNSRHMPPHTHTPTATIIVTSPYTHAHIHTLTHILTHAHTHTHGLTYPPICSLVK